MLDEAIGRFERRLSNSDDFDAGNDLSNTLCEIRNTQTQPVALHCLKTARLPM
jgi:hypothetical protein